ncbi:CvpA family protein [Cerasibacillus terrae]|uniref:CvpA family protein n=1 Tax=Cerasibacillus terrae TaxID=2498845 RepID=A0A5C8NNQ0_9BACI|nr:CvpA family protein [Cerasibacillus terrae]TXL62525.1 CvpA family protein [Cerasibacillus terrae]
MANLIVILFLLFGFLMGLKRGLILQVFHLVGFIVAFIVAALSFKKLSSHLEMWIPFPGFSDQNVWSDVLNSAPVQDAFYNAIAFAIIFFITKIILQIIASMLDFVASFPILNSVNKLLGAFLGFVEVYLIVFIVLFILSLTPIDTIQNWLSTSTLAKVIIQSTPILSNKIQDLWFVSLQSII